MNKDAWYQYFAECEAVTNRNVELVEEKFKECEVYTEKVLKKKYPECGVVFTGHAEAIKAGYFTIWIDTGSVNLPIGESYVPVEPTGPEYADMVKGVHYRKDKQRYEVRCFYKGKAHNLGVYKDVGVANEHATDFRNLGPDGYLTKYGKWGTV